MWFTQDNETKSEWLQLDITYETLILYNKDLFVIIYLYNLYVHENWQIKNNGKKHQGYKQLPHTTVTNNIISHK